MAEFNDIMEEERGRMNSGKKSEIPSFEIFIPVINRFPFELCFLERTVAGYFSILVIPDLIDTR